MRGFGRQCRGQGKVFVSLVRQTERQLLETGRPVGALAQAAQTQVQNAGHLPEPRRARWVTKLTVALAAHHQITTQSRRLTAGKALRQCKIVNAHDLTIAPICKGKSNCPTQFGRKPGLIAEPASGFIFAFQLPVGNPADPRYVVPLVDKVQRAVEQTAKHPTPAIHSLAGDLALNDSKLRETLHSRGILTVGIPRTIAPLSPVLPPAEVRRLLREAGLQRTRTPAQTRLACACGYSRPIVESLIASLLSRGAGHLTYKGQRGATVQLGMIVMAHNGATLARTAQGRLSKRAQKLRRMLGLKARNCNQFKTSKN
jgi:Transposase DDE domain